MGEVKVMKAMKSLYQKYVGVGFFLGFFLVLLVYFTVSEQFAIKAPNVVSQSWIPYVSRNSPGAEETHLPKSEDDDKKTEHLPNRDKVNESPTDTAAVTSEEEEKKQESDFKSFEEEKKEDDAAEKVEIKERDITPVTRKEDERKETSDVKPLINPSKPICDVQNWGSDICDINGDVRTLGASSSVLVVPQNPMGNPQAHEWKIRPYSRKHMTSIKEVTIKELDNPQDAPTCTIKHNVSAVIFALGGLIGNYWHDYADVLVPLFVASRKFDGEVQFLVSNIQMWYVGKYMPVLKRLSKYEIIDFDKDDQVRCYPQVIVGIRIHQDFRIDPSIAPNGYTMVDFTKFMRETYGLERDSPIRLIENPGKKPRLMIISRRQPRKLVNLQEVVQLGERLGFEVVIGDPPFNVNVGDFGKDVNSVDVLMGVHGAGLTNCVFLPTNAVFIQIVPYGKMEHIAKIDFGDPARDMKLKYLEYSITAEESTLMDMFGPENPIIKDPDAIHKSGWDKVAEFYLGKQDVKLDVNRFAPVLLKTLEYLRE